MRLFSALLFIMSISFFSCKQEKKSEETSTTQHMHTPVVYVTNYPLYYFANRIGGLAIELHFPASELSEPAMWTPETDTIAAMQQADFVFINGATYEKWLMNTSLPDDIIINTGASFENQLLGNGEVFTHSHGDEKAHTHTGTAYTTWLNLEFANAQALAIKNALTEKFPNLETTFNSNFNALSQELLELDQEFKSVGEQMQNPVIFSHPVYQYFQDAYGIKGKSLHWEPTDVINHDKMHELKHLIENTPVTTLIWEAKPKAESIKTLQDKGIYSAVILPLSGKPSQGDFLSGIKQNLKTLKNLPLQVKPLL
ncbi:metal ABC transporter substrate-binding protein [Formosa haliotis]|uniref:metal ABC transporter substrate-binding protein n=1 Tax=Formosa haliotis TaxID=1555194 RepID=UPI001C3F9424|nr:metal ABC transporter substrate-binding protein [Formosa haliotis]